MKIGKQNRRYIKDQFAKMAEGNLVDDSERLGMQRKMQEVGEQSVAAQQRALNRTSQALASGSPVQAGAITEGAQNLGQAAADASVKAAGQAETAAKALEEKRKAAIMGASERLIQRNREDAQTAIDTTLAGLEIAGEILMPT